MNTLITVGLFVGLAFVLAVGLFSVANDLRLRIEYPPLAVPDGDDDADETELANDAGPQLKNPREPLRSAILGE